MGSFVAIGNEGQTELRATNKESSGKIPAESKFFIAESINIAPTEEKKEKPSSYTESVLRIAKMLKPFTADEA